MAKAQSVNQAFRIFIGAFEYNRLYKKPVVEFFRHKKVESQREQTITQLRASDAFLSESFLKNLSTPLRYAHLCDLTNANGADIYAYSLD